MKTVVSIKKLWYANVINKVGDPQVGLTGAEVKTLLATAKTIENVHGDTWAYEEAEASVTDYLNQLNGKVFYRDSVAGAVSMAFSIGQYAYETKADLQGGKATETTWERPETQELIYKCMIAQTKDGTYIVFPKAAVAARGGMVEKIAGLLVSAVAMDTGIKGLASEKWLDQIDVEGEPAGE